MALYPADFPPPLTIPIDSCDPDGQGKAIAQAILDGNAFVTEFSMNPDRETVALSSITGETLVTPMSGDVEVSITVRLCAPLVHIDDTPVVKKSPPFEKRPAKSGLKRKIVFQEYSK